MPIIHLLVFMSLILTGCGRVTEHASVEEQSPKKEALNNGPTSDEDLAALQGTWQQVSGRPFGVDLPENVVRETRITIEGNKKKVTLSGELIFSDVVVELDSNASPKVWDERPTTDSGEPLVFRGIYKLEGDTLTRCNSSPGDERPTEFASPKEGHFNLQVFQRVK